MPTELPKQFDPTEVEARLLSFWEGHRYFDANPNPDKKPHVIMIPLPNVTGALHMGHALNGTLQDLLTRWRRMQGYEALWMPGTDHAGIATQAVVERRMLEEEGLTRHDIGREALVERIWSWKDAFEKRILGQLKKLGASCDWRRVRFTLDEVCSNAVRRTFFKMFQDGYIYRGKRLVNWDTFLQTAVADDEVYTEDVAGQFWTFNYPVVDESGQPTGERISFSTTRPETMLGDTAVCVHPTDERYLHLIGNNVQIPVNGRLIPVIADALLADKELGTGCVKVTPAHDPNDYACGLRNKLPMINILNADGTINSEGGEFAGLDRYKAREAIVAKMEALGHFEKVEDRQIPMKYSDRSKTSIEPYLSDQWFVKMDTLAQGAIDAVDDGRVQFFPERYKSSYLDWLGEKRDWCISRQLWWGHRIPVWMKSFSPNDPMYHLVKQNITSDDTSAAPHGLLVWPSNTRGETHDGTTVNETRHSAQIQFVFGEGTYLNTFKTSDGQITALVCVDVGRPDREQELERQGFTRDPDVLDTWFSSALWPHATLGWPDTAHNPPLAGEETPSESTTGANEVLPYFYPGSVLVTSRDIITLWVARMVLTGLYNMGDVPFHHVHVHPKILDGFGQTMSKSKGNGVDPMDLIEKYGADGLRFTIASFAGETQDVRLPVGYECPHCGAVIPQELKHQKAIPGGGKKPRVKCAKCKKDAQYTSPWFSPDEGEPVARIVSERFEYGRNFCNKLWNAARFAMMNLEGYSPVTVTFDELAFEDRWIFSRLATVTTEVTELLGRYQFDQATRLIREFVWNEFCDWYLEMIKPRLRAEAGEGSPRAAAQQALITVLDTIVRLLHPFTPFITEELWQTLNEIAPNRPVFDAASRSLVPQSASHACIIASWPDKLESLCDPAIEERALRFQQLVVAIRNVRGTYNITAGGVLAVHLRCTAEAAAGLEALKSQFPLLAKAELAAIGPNVSRPKSSASFTLGDIDGYVPLEGLIDFAAELERQKKEADKLRGFISNSEKKLENRSFVDRAPPEVVDEVRQTMENLRKQLISTEEVIAQLAGS